MTSVMCVALAIYFESASSKQPIDDQYSIALVVRNRMHDTGMTPCEVVFQPKQFSSLNHALDARGRLKSIYRPHGKAWHRARNIAKLVLRGGMPDITNGARYYYANYIERPAWSRGMILTSMHGKHLYWRKKKKHLQYAKVEARIVHRSPVVTSNDRTIVAWD